MKVDQIHIDQIKSSFAKMESKEDLLKLLNEAKPFVYGEKTVPFELKQLTWHINPKLSKKRYYEFKIKKKSGTFRTINAPEKGLKSLQKTLSFILQCVFTPHENAFGFAKDKSIVDNAKIHLAKIYVYNIDLKDFFSSIDQARVWKCLQIPPFNLVSDSRIKLCNAIASLCCTELEVERKDKDGNWELVKRNVLPQGAPTSPVITNIICQRLDYLLSGVAKRFGLSYSRYADDITFSSMYNAYKDNSDFIKELHRIISNQGFHTKDSKTRLQKQGYRQEVTGLLVNEKPNVQKRYIKQLRKWLYYWEQYGYKKANVFFLNDRLINNEDIKSENMSNVISGKLDFLKMVKGEDSQLYVKLRDRFDKLINRKLKKHNSSIQTNINNEVEVNEISIVSRKDLPVSFISLPIKHNPKDLLDLLKKFSMNGSALKYTTHSWDAGRDDQMFKDLESFLTLAKKEYKVFSYQLRTLSNNLNGKIYGFLFKKDIKIEGWGTHRIKFGWSSPELLSACKMDKTLNPEDVILPIQYQTKIAGKTIHKFKHVIDIFKNEIEIRDENSALLNLILQKHDSYLADFEIPQINNLDNKTFYTDVQWLSKALDLIFENIQKRPLYREVIYTMIETKENTFVLEILHKDSFNIGKSINDEKLRLSKGDFSIIKNRLTNLCDWSIESRFIEGNFRINYLTSDIATVAHSEIGNVEGFKHILTFYK